MVADEGYQQEGIGNVTEPKAASGADSQILDVTAVIGVAESLGGPDTIISCWKV